MEKDIPFPSSNATHYYVDSMEDDDLQHGAKIEKEKPPTQENISNFLQLPQEVITTKRTRVEALVDYSQSHILTSNEHVDKLHTILKKKEQIAQEKDRKRVEKEFTKHARVAEKQKQREAKEKRAYEREVRRVENALEIIAAQEEAKRLYKAKWTSSACEEQGQKLHDLIKQGYENSCTSPYLGRTTCM